MDQVRATEKQRDSWWTVLFVDPIASRLVRHAAARAWITPNRLTVVAFLIGLGAAAAFLQAGVHGERWWLIVGALTYHVSFVIDCVDGKLARLRGVGSPFGHWLDFTFDRLLVVACGIGLLGGGYLGTEDPTYLLLASLVIFLNFFHQLNGQIMADAIRRATKKIADSTDGTATAGTGTVGTGTVGTGTNGSTGTGGTGTDDSFGQISTSARARLGLFLRFRTMLARHRIRADLFSAIEFQVAVFIVGPLFGLVVPVTAVACALLFLFELAAIAKFGLAAHSLRIRMLGSRAATTTVVPTQIASDRAAAAMTDR